MRVKTNRVIHLCTIAFKECSDIKCTISVGMVMSTLRSKAISKQPSGIAKSLEVLMLNLIAKMTSKCTHSASLGFTRSHLQVA